MDSGVFKFSVSHTLFFLTRVYHNLIMVYIIHGTLFHFSTLQELADQSTYRPIVVKGAISHEVLQVTMNILISPLKVYLNECASLAQAYLHNVNSHFGCM